MLGRTSGGGHTRRWSARCAPSEIGAKGEDAQTQGGERPAMLHEGVLTAAIVTGPGNRFRYGCAAPARTRTARGAVVRWAGGRWNAPAIGTTTTGKLARGAGGPGVSRHVCLCSARPTRSGAAEGRAMGNTWGERAGAIDEGGVGRGAGGGTDKARCAFEGGQGARPSPAGGEAVGWARDTGGALPTQGPGWWDELRRFQAGCGLPAGATVERVLAGARRDHGPENGVIRPRGCSVCGRRSSILSPANVLTKRLERNREGWHRVQEVKARRLGVCAVKLVGCIGREVGTTTGHVRGRRGSWTHLLGH